jgi:hypothetical protein
MSTRSSESTRAKRICPVAIALWSLDRVRHLPPVAPGKRSSNTGDAMLVQRSEFTPLVDDGAALRLPDGGPRPTPMEEDRCHSTEA